MPITSQIRYLRWEDGKSIKLQMRKMSTYSKYVHGTHAFKYLSDRTSFWKFLEYTVVNILFFQVKSSIWSQTVSRVDKVILQLISSNNL